VNRARTALLVADSLVGAETHAALSDAPVPPAELRRRLKAWEPKFAHAQSEATLKAVRSDWSVVFGWCERAGACPLPLALADLVRFLSDMLVMGRRRATLDRYVYTITLVHSAVALASPTRHPDWPLEWKAITRKLATLKRNAPRQAAALRSAEVELILATLGDAPRDLRDAALLSFASDTLCRESEIAAACREDVVRTDDGSAWTYFLGRSKNDPEGLGAYRFVSDDTKRRLDRWCKAAAIESGPLFLPVGGRRKRDAEHRPRGLEPAEVSRILRRRAARAGVVPAAGRVSGHSTRVGSAVELIENAASLLDVMYAGGWKSTRQPLKYGKKALAGRNAMAMLRARRR